MSMLSSDGHPPTSSAPPEPGDPPGWLPHPRTPAPLPVVERESAIARLRHHLDAACAGQGRLVLLAGEAGIGKTTLAAVVCRDAVERGAWVLTAKCYDLTDPRPYGPWSELFAHPRASPAIEELPTALVEPGGLERVESQLVIVDQLRAYLEAASARQPLVVLLEDLHWADPASLEILVAVTRMAPELPLLLLATYRHDELSRQHRLRQLLPLLTHDAENERIELQRLSIDGVKSLVIAHYLIGGDQGSRLARYLHERADGNAFYTAQLLRALEEAGGLQVTETGWTLGDLRQVLVPATLRDVVDARYLQLDATAQERLDLAAVIGQDVPVSLWAAAADCAEEDLLPAVEAATAGRPIEALPGGAGVRFLHALVREALYENVLPLRRRLLHRRVATALLGLPSPDPDALAYHLRHSGDLRAVEWLLRAGERAERAYAMVTAIERFETAQD